MATVSSNSVQATNVKHSGKRITRFSNSRNLRIPGSGPLFMASSLSPFISSESFRSINPARFVVKTSARASVETKRVKLSIRIPIQVKYGETVAISGSAKWLGRWKNPINLTWTENGWIVDIEADRGEESEFKFLILGDGGNSQVWESGSNRKLKIPSEGSFFEVTAAWNKTDTDLGLNPKGESNSPKSDLDRSDDNNSVNSSRTDVETSEFSANWQGREVSFMRSNQHSGSRGGVWNTHGLSGAALRIVEGDKGAGNWWRKLDVVQEVIQEPKGSEHLESLIFSAIYLKWINSGQITCVEDGGHHRPNRHAEISRRIFRKLEISVGLPSTTPEETLAARRIHPCLPSFTAEFTASVPLTRIRDIAHRNDIPHDLKQEIKHTIQNKLHRCAGPEDLIATEAMLKRVSRVPGEYSEEFVNQMRIFYQELKDFFNASSLTEKLDSILPSLDESGSTMLRAFLAAKQRVDNLSPDYDPKLSRNTTETLISALHTLTGLRAVLLSGLRSGLRNDASDESIAMRQKWRLAEIGLEDYSFVLMSRFLNVVDGFGGAASLADDAMLGNGMDRLSHCLGATVLAIRQVGLSGWQAPECIAIENELYKWQETGLPKSGTPEDKRTWALRLKATLDRTRRLAEQYTEALLRLFSDNAQTLGTALGIPENSVKTFAEGEIRASVVFQLAKLCSLLLRALRQVAGAEGWDVIMPGTAVGTVIEVDRIEPGLPAVANHHGPIILLVRGADGDEEVKAAGSAISGVILCHELPHLSHLGVRARQEGVVFVTCEDELKLAEVRSKLGKFSTLEAYPDRVQLALGGSREEAAVTVTAGNLLSTTQSDHNGAISGISSGVVFGESVIQLADADVANSGAKAASCGTLAILSRDILTATGPSPALTPTGFRVPSGAIIPFGAMESTLKSSGSFQTFQQLLDKIETAELDGGQLDTICRQLRDLITTQTLDSSFLESLERTFRKDSRLIVRSSANVEDLAGMSGAGLYDSIPNVQLADPVSFRKAVAQVWASLYTRRAVLSRRVARVAQKDAQMAILVQELLSPDVSFVLHTRNPIDGDEDIVSAELALGLGETLASGTRGTPWRLSVSKKDGSVKTLAFANFSDVLAVDGARGLADGTVVKRTADYSAAMLSVSDVYRSVVGKKLAYVGQFLELRFGSAQDVEGCIVGDDIFIVQARPQP